MKKTMLFLLSILTIAMFMTSTVIAATVDLSITGTWSADDFTVTEAYDSTNPKLDGRVFGVAPSAGSTTVHLQVSTAGSVSYNQGYSFTTGSGTYTLAHDWYGYTDVTLAGTTYTFGDATWETSGIITDLVGPDDVKATLWTDKDITTGDPSKLSFRMFGTGDGLSADFFVGSRSHEQIGNQFLLWEYYDGEEIRSDSYSASTNAVPLPGAIWVLGLGLTTLGVTVRRRR